MTPDPPDLHLHRWLDRRVVGVALVAAASGFGQFGVVAALGDVARGFGQLSGGGSIANQVGLSGTVLGAGLAIIRLASLGSLPLIGIADRVGRRRTLLTTVGFGLAFTIAAAASPGYWWFVAIFALGRPLLSTANALAQVIAAEETGSRDRTAAVALVTAGYGVGAGLTALLHSLASGVLGFRGLFALAVVPLCLVGLVRRWIEEPDRFEVAAAGNDHPAPVLGPVGRRFRRRLAVVVAIGFAVAVITGPATSFVYLYAQDVIHQGGPVTATMVVAAGLAGLAGLLAGRWLADRLGRRPTGACGMVGLAVFGALTYSGSSAALICGYVLGVFSGAVIAPATGALLAELFPTSVRASVMGWWVTASVVGAVLGLVAFGAVADAGNRFAVAAAAIFLPAALGAALFWLLPETRGREPEDLWPDPPARA